MRDPEPDEFAPLFFPEGTICPVSVTSITEELHGNHTHYRYKITPDIEQGALIYEKIKERRRHPSYVPPSIDELEQAMNIGGVEQAILPMEFEVSAPFRIPELQIGMLFDLSFTPRERLDKPTFGFMDRILQAVRESFHEDRLTVLTVPVCDLEAAEYDGVPDIDGLPSLGHIDEGIWRRATTLERIQLIAQAREEQG